MWKSIPRYERYIQTRQVSYVGLNRYGYRCFQDLETMLYQKREKVRENRRNPDDVWFRIAELEVRR